MSEYPSSRILLNILGGSLTLLSTQLPWINVGTYPIMMQSGGILAVAFYWALAGAILSFLSRFGGVMTIVGMISFAGEPSAALGSGRPGLGILIAFGGALITFAGLKWSVPRFLMRRKEVVGGILYSVGFLIVLTLVVSSGIIGSSFSSGAGQMVVSAPLLLVGVLMTALGLKLFLSPERRETPFTTLSSAA